MASQVASQIRDAAWLKWISTLVGATSTGETSRQRYAATFPSDRYCCLLDDLPLHLVPRWFFQSPVVRGVSSQPLFLNPHCTVLPAGQLPDELSGQTELLANFAVQGSIAWVRNPLTRVVLPFWLGPKLQVAIQGLSADDPAPPTLPAADRSLLAAAGILVARKQDARDLQQWNELTEKSAMFQERNYVPLNHLLHPFHVAALRRYYRCLIRQGQIRLGDPQSPRRYIAYNEPVARFFHQQIAATIEAVVGQPIKPSYVYMASYLSGAVLKKHIDREQCEFSVTLCLDFSPEPAQESPWPIRLDTSRGKTTAYQALGDGLVYRGTRVPHYRYALGEGKTSTSIFFHYVAADFLGSLD